MAKKTIPQIIQSIKRGSGSGNVFNAKQVKPHLDKELQEVADAIKEFMIAEAELNRQHKLRRDQSGFVGKSVVTMTTDGGKISLPDYAVDMDAGRKPGAKMVPLESLIAWLKRYRILGRVKKTGVFKKASTDSINAAAYAIQQSIYRNGIQARPFIEATLDFQQILIANVVDEIMIPEIVSVLDLYFTDKK